MAILFEGNCNGKAINVELGPDGGGKPRVRWEMEVVDGEHKGKRASYSGKLDQDNIRFTKRDMMTIGWKGKDVGTFLSDVKAANLTVPFSAEIATNTYQDTGKTSQWTSVRFAGAAKPLGTLDNDTAKKLNQWFAEAGDSGAPSQSTNDDSLPF